jgi:tetratricopeptide (TPR) repeat protein
MAPEQANGGLVDARCDVFGLGAMLCEVLTGQPPYAGANDLEVLLKAGRADLACAFARLDDCGADLGLVRLAKRSLAADPADRPRDAGVLAQEMAAHRESMEARLRQAELAQAEARARAEEERRRQRLRLALTATVLLALLLAGGVWIWRWRRQEARERLALEALTQARGLQEQARRRDDPGKWAEARALGRRAEALLEQGTSRPELVEWVRTLLRELEDEEADRRLLARLEEARLQKATDRSRDIGFAEESAVPLYAEALGPLGVTSGTLPVEQAAARIRQRRPHVRTQIVAALDDWIVQVSRSDPKLAGRLEAVVAAADPDPWRQRLRAARSKKDQEALERLAREARIDRQPPETLQLLASALRQRGSVEQANGLLRRAQAQYPGDFWINIYLGWSLWREPGKAADAVPFLRAAAALRPRSPTVLALLAVALVSQGDVEGAIAVYRRAAALEPELHVVHLELGSLLFQKGDVDGAIAAYRRGRALKPKDPGINAALGNALSRKGDLDGAIAAWRRALAARPDETLHYNIGAALMKKGDPDGAIAAWRRAVRVKPAFFEAHDQIGTALLQKDDREGALAAFRQALQVKADSRPYYHIGVALERQGDRDGALAAWRRAVALKPDHFDLNAALGTLLFRRGDLDGAVAAFRNALAMKPDHPRLHYSLGMALAWKGDVVGAVAAHRRAVELDPDHLEGHSSLGSALLRQGRVVEALRAYRDGQRRAGKKPADRKRWAGWVRAAERLVELDGRLPSFLKGTASPAGPAERIELASLCLGKGLNAAAARFYTEAFAADKAQADNLAAGNRWDGARAAALAGCGRGADAPLDARERARLRRQALDWLQAERAAWGSRFVQGRGRPFVVQNLRRWQQDTDLACVRDPRALDRLPAGERKGWLALWADVEALAGGAPLQLLERGRACAARRQWDQAANCYARSLKLAPAEDGHFWFEYAAVLLLSGDATGYRKACQRMARLCCGKAPGLRAYHMARAATLAPEVLVEMGAPLKRAAAELDLSPAAFWSITERAAVLYRGDRLERVVPLLEASLKADGGKPGRSVVTWLWLALANHRLGKHEEARRWLEKAAKWLDAQGGRLKAGAEKADGLDLHNWLEAHVLLREAQALLRRSGKPAKGAAKE